jgi:hypothetical protein
MCLRKGPRSWTSVVTRPQPICQGSVLCGRRVYLHAEHGSAESRDETEKATAHRFLGKRGNCWYFANPINPYVSHVS